MLDSVVSPNFEPDNFQSKFFFVAKSNLKMH